MPQVSPVFSFDNSPGPGEKASYSPGDSITATLDSVQGVTYTTWTISHTDETTLPSNYTLVQSGIRGETVTFDASIAGTAGILSATVNGGVDPQTGNASTAMTATAKWYVPTANGGLEVGCVNEEFESDPVFGSTGEINAAIRTADSASTALDGATPYLEVAATTDATPETLLSITIPAGATARIEYAIVARTSTQSSFFDRVAKAHRNAGSTVLDASATPISDTNGITGSPSVGLAASSNDIVLTITGVAATAIDWSVSARSFVFMP